MESEHNVREAAENFHAAYGIYKKSDISTGLSAQDRLIRLLYGNCGGRLLLGLLTKPCVSRAAGRIMDLGASAAFVGFFARRHHIDMSECRKKSFGSFNDFFMRELVTGARSVDMGEDTFVSPCDGRLSVYDISDEGSRLCIKDTSYTLEQLIRDKRLAYRYRGGRAWIFRLCTDDYHRYIYNVSGEQSKVRRIDGLYHTVNPFANDCLPIYKENTREYCLIKTKKLGTILFMEVGAMLVGRIENNDRSRHMAVRGDEKGSFAFGGSTIIIMTQKGAVIPRRDICKNTLHGLETRVLQGEITGYTGCAPKGKTKE